MPIAPPPPTNTPSSHHRVPPAPPMRPWYFYTSPQVLDDPLSPLPTATPQKATKYPPRPFSAVDTKAIEAAYQDLLAEKQILASQPSTPRTQTGMSQPSTPRPSARKADISDRHNYNRSSSASPRYPTGNRDKRRSVEFVTSSPLKGRSSLESDDGRAEPIETAEEGKPSGVDIPVPMSDRDASRQSQTSELPNLRLALRRHNSASSATNPHGTPPSVPTGGSYSPASYNNPAGTTNNPFIRAAVKERSSSPAPSRSSLTSATPVRKKQSLPNVQVPSSPSTSYDKSRREPSRFIPVGAQRLHQVKLPDLTLEPIYWSPLVGLDNAGVVRGTWFYRDTMLPVETEKANALERGYMEVQAWTEEWSWELESAVRVGEVAEAKIRWHIPRSVPTRPGTAISTDEPGKKATTTMSSGFEDEVGNANENDELLGDENTAQGNSGEWVIYANGVTAYIMRDSLLAGFAGVNRRPLATIKRGKSVGTCVVRGFDEEAWRKIYGEQSGLSNKGKIKVGAVRADEGRREEKQKITDLVLVIHGIGQKLSERMDSFNFTHATNSFRRHINLELRDPNVRPVLRPEGVGVMVLPINWRSKIKLDAVDAPDTQSDEEDERLFSLTDITPRTIPAVRNLIGDVMVDIPYYLSHHKSKMVAAVVKEANRVYGLWCENNPGFRDNGRVHLIAHSLGSAIALDILSAQPTFINRRRNSSIPRGLDATGDGHFDFDTTNLFCVGSPAGFFLLLNRKGLLPRRGRKREDTGEVSAERGVFGSLSVDNVYNVIHYSDPIAYRLNPTVDTDYASSLRPALVPSTATTFFSSFSSLSTSPTASPKKPALAFPTAARSNSQPAHDPTAPPPDREAFERLPSNMELETHDFSREEIAEKRMFLLNDNGQIDWYLRTGGPLESAYLNMLGAHSSYWESRDFVRFLVIECGRERGRRGVLKEMVAVKRRGIQGMVGKAGGK